MKGKMKYIQGGAEFQLHICEKEIPAPKVGQVLVRVCFCGVCGSDLSLLRKRQEIGPLGHEVSAIVEEIGEGVTDLKKGDLVVVEDLGRCGKCSNCKNDNSYHCSDMIGWNGQSGMGQYLCVERSLINPVAGLTPFEASLTEPLVVSINAWKKAQLPPLGVLVVYGMGAIAILCAQVAVFLGADKVICVGNREGSRQNTVREKELKRKGIAVTYRSRNSFKEELKELTGRKAIDAFIVTTPPSTLPEVIDLCDYGTRVVPIGLAFDQNGKAELDIDKMIMNKIELIPFISEPASGFPLAVDMIRKKVVEPDKIITHRIPFERIDQLKKLYMEDEGVIKATIDFTQK